MSLKVKTVRMVFVFILGVIVIALITRGKDIFEQVLVADRLAVSAQHALYADHCHGNSGVADGRSGSDIFFRIHPQFAHHARLAADRRGSG